MSYQGDNLYNIISNDMQQFKSNSKKFKSIPCGSFANVKTHRLVKESE